MALRGGEAQGARRLHASARAPAPAGDLPDPPAREAPLSDPEAALERKLDASRLERAISRLPADSREVLLLRDVHDLPYEEIASILALPLGTVRSRLSRARWALREALDPG